MASESPKTRNQVRQRRLQRPSLSRNEDSDEEDSQPCDSDTDEEVSSPYRRSDMSLRNISILSQKSNRSQLQDASYSTQGSPAFSDKSFSSPSYLKSNSSLNSSNNSKHSRSPASPKLYPDLDDVTPKRTSKLYPGLDDSLKAKKRSGTKANESLSEESNENSPRKPSSNSSGFMPVLMIIVVLSCLVGLIYIFHNNKSNTGSTDPPLEKSSPFEKFIKEIDQMEKMFSSQPPRSWRTVKATSKHVLNETDPTYPSIILMGVESKNAKLGTCIANKITSLFESSVGHYQAGRTTDIQTYRDLSPGQQKLTLDKAFIEAFQDLGSKSILVENLQQLSAEASLLLYSYCDSDNAPFKDVLIILTVNVPLGGSVDASSVERYLSDIWQRDIHVDKVDALMSRVANNIVIVNPEAEHVYNREC